MSRFAKQLLLILTLCLSIVEDSNAASNDLSTTRFQQMSTEHGLSQKTVQSIFQDQTGFLWFGTQEGLNRYDGRVIKVFRHSSSDPSSISHDVIRDIAEDQNGDLWIATNGGLNRYLKINESFERVNILDDKGNPISKLNSLFIDSSGQIWVGTDGFGIYWIDPKKNDRQIQKLEKIIKLENADVRTVFEDSRGRFWIGTDGDGVFLLNSNKEVSSHFQYEQSNTGSLSNNRIRSIIEDHRGQIWIGTRGGGLNKFDELTKQFSRFKNDPNNIYSLSHNRVYKVFEDSKQQLWVATDAGISLYQEDSNRFIRIQHNDAVASSLSHNRVLSVYQDISGLIWIGTLSGVNQWNPLTAEFIHYRHSASNPNSLTHNYVHGLLANEKNDILAATFGGGLNFFEPNQNTFSSIKMVDQQTHQSVDDYLTTLMIDKQNRLWVGTPSNGVYLQTKNENKFINFSNDPDNNNSLSANGVTDIFQDNDGDIWIATYRAGLNRLNKDKSGFVHYRISEDEYSLTNENIFQLLEDDEGYLWLTTDGGGIFRFDKNSNRFINFSFNVNDPKSLSGNNATAIFQDSKGRFWIGTQGNGLNRWEPEDRRRGVAKFKHYNLENGLNSSTVNGIIEDQQNFIWVSTNKGVSKIDPISNKISNYNIADEIHGNELNLGALAKVSDGRFYFGGLNGISAFYPDRIKENSFRPNVVLTKIASEGREVNIDSPLSEMTSVTFDHQDYLITFEFAALDFAQPNKNQYQYQLEGLDSNWVNIGNLNRATFTNLPAGNYVLKVKGSNNDGVWSDESINLNIMVLPAPWASWWAYSLYAATFSLLLLLIIRSQAKRMASQELFKARVSEQVEEKTSLYIKNNEFLNEQMNQLKYYANVDLETGLPNQKYLCDLVNANVQWLNQFYDFKENCPKLCIALIRLANYQIDKSEDLKSRVNEVAKKFNEKLRSLEIDFKLLVRWGEQDLGVVFYADNEAEAERYIQLVMFQLKNIVVRKISSLEKTKIKSSFTLLPFAGVNQGAVQSEDILMLTEHLLHLVSNSSEIDFIGILGANQKLNAVKFRQIMSVEQIKSLQEILILRDLSKTSN